MRVSEDHGDPVLKIDIKRSYQLIVKEIGAGSMPQASIEGYRHRIPAESCSRVSV